MRALAILTLVIFMTGCAGHKQVKNADGSETKTPAGVAIMDSSALSHSTCSDPEKFEPVPDGIDKCEPGDDACHFSKGLVGVANTFAKMEHDEEQKEGLKDGCHAQVAKQTKAYYEAEETKYRQTGNFGQTLVRWVSGVFIVDTAMDNKNTEAGDTNVETVNVNGTNTAGAGTEGTGGATGGVTNNVNIGPGSITNAQDGADVLSGEKATKGDGNTDDDSPNTSFF